VGPDDRVRPTRYDHVPGAGEPAGQPVPGGFRRQDPVLAALDDQHGNADPGQVGAEVLAPRGGAAEHGGRGRTDGDVETVLPGLVADPDAAKQADVVGPIQVGLDRSRPVGGDLTDELVQDVTVDPVRVVAGSR